MAIAMNAKSAKKSNVLLPPFASTVSPVCIYDVGGRKKKDGAPRCVVRDEKKSCDLVRPTW